MSTFNTATQTSAPLWVRARALAMHTLCALGSFAIGSAFWGALSDITGLSFALQRRGRLHGRRAAAGAALPAAHGRGAGGDAGHALGRLLRRRRARPRGRPGGGGDRLPHPRRAQRRRSSTR